MKHLLILFACITSAIVTNAQTGGIVFSYNQAGYRMVREYDPIAPWSKPGTDNSGNQADTVIGYFPGEEANNLLEDKIFVRAYPNPVQDVLFVENRSWKEGNSATLKMYDVAGKLLLEKTTTQPKESISMNMLPPGNYNVKYYTNYTYIISWKITKL